MAVRGLLIVMGFADKCAELNDILRDDPNQLRLDLDEVMMAA